MTTDNLVKTANQPIKYAPYGRRMLVPRTAYSGRYVYPANEYLLPNVYEKFDSSGRLIDATARRRLKRYIEGFNA